MTVVTLHTADELLRLTDEGHRYELVEGELRKMSPAGEEHGAIGVAIVASLHAHVKQHGLGRVYGPDTGFLLSSSPDTVPHRTARSSLRRVSSRRPGTSPAHRISRSK